MNIRCRRMRKFQKEEACEPKIYSINNFTLFFEVRKLQSNIQKPYEEQIKSFQKSYLFYNKWSPFTSTNTTLRKFCLLLHGFFIKELSVMVKKNTIMIPLA
ncbi:hypothetical protein RIR_jg35832.t1 [Rhizophagus irregularis DAOM 181602=DAOM 197198]|nr:hypothetical protein RIR_jg35832.t1 [Rhizophagus irregularis DAOM 181602=DAOM 197198]